MGSALAITLAGTNIIDALAAFLFVVIAIIALAHRISWPFLNRPMHRLAELNITQRNKVFAVIGVGLICLALGVTPEWLKRIIEALIG